MRNPLRQLLLPLVLSCALVPSAHAAVFINEIHYDNANVDVGEAVEIVATAGEDLSLYSITRYNGSNNRSYLTPPESGITRSTASCGGTVGVAVISYPQDGLQNGSPDGLALAGPAGLVQFLSYEGVMPGSGGPADGILSVDIGVAESSTAPLGTSLQLAGDGSVASPFTWQPSATSTFGACNTGQTFPTGPDVAPTVTSTVPADGADDVAHDASLAVSFSEPVTLGADWFALVCATSGPRAVADTVVSGGPISYTIDPNTDFAFDEACTLTIAAAGVTDQDGMPDGMAADVVSAFAIAAMPVDVPPSVASTTPADSAANVSPGITVQIVFNEPVTTDAAAFALRCDGVAQPFVFAGSGNAYTLDPVADLPELEDCQIAITAAGVLDQDGTIEAMVANFLATFTTRTGTGAYYDTVDATSCTALRPTLHAAIDDHQFFPYTATATDTWNILNAADQDPANGGNILDVYKNVSYPKISGGTGAYNREHTWPNSYGYNDLENYEAYTDTHMLYASDSPYNFTRNNIPYDDCPQSAGCTVLPTVATNGRGGGPTDVYPGNHNWYSTALDSFQVWNGRKGDVARAVLYMDIRYEGGTNALSGRAEPDLVATDDRALIQTTPSEVFSATGYMGLKSTLIAWHKADPPDVAEQLRNDVVQSYQGNRNPFIDHPEWVACLYECNRAAQPPVDALFRNGFE